MDDPIVKRMQEKFGAEIRTVIDQKDPTGHHGSMEHTESIKARIVAFLSILNPGLQLMDGFNLQEMLSQARQQAEKLQEKMQQITVEASSGGGSVTVRMSGQKQLQSITIEPEVVKSGDIEMLQDLVVAAVNEAARKVDEALKSSLGGMLGGMGLPGM